LTYIFVFILDVVAMLSHQPSWRYHPSANPGNEHAFERTYASAASALRSFDAPSRRPLAHKALAATNMIDPDDDQLQL